MNSLQLTAQYSGDTVHYDIVSAITKLRVNKKVIPSFRRYSLTPVFPLLQSHSHAYYSKSHALRERKHLLRSIKGFRDACRSPPLKNAKKQGGNAITQLSPMHAI